MAQEQFAGPEHYTEFDPEKFLRDMNLIKEIGENGEKGLKDTDDAQNTGDAPDAGDRRS